MLTLINANKMVPPIGPIGLDYIAGYSRDAGIESDLVDLCLIDDTDTALQEYFSSHSPELVGISFRNVDDCFWPSAQWFVPDLAGTIQKIHNLTDAPIVVGGTGFSIFAQRIVKYTDSDFGIRGDGEQAIVRLYKELRGAKNFGSIAGLIWRDNNDIHSNPPAWPEPLSLPIRRDVIDNRAYFNKGGQCGLETKRGCNQRCIYCADPLAKGTALRLRDPAEVADEAESLIAQKIDVVHLCDSEFNIPRSHAYAVCEEFIRRSIAENLQWYTYMAIVPFDAELAAMMRKAGCVGIDFTGDSACPKMLEKYRQRHRKDDLAIAVRLCKDNDIRVMIDLLLGGPGETPETVAETIDFIKQIGPDCVGVPLGIRIYPDTEMATIVAGEGPLEKNPNIHYRYNGPVDFFKPTFYISESLGQRPAKLVRELIDGDERFFEPMEEVTDEVTVGSTKTDHNYNDNTELVEAIQKGARGAYWDILCDLRNS